MYSRYIWYSRYLPCTYVLPVYNLPFDSFNYGFQRVEVLNFDEVFVSVWSFMDCACSVWEVWGGIDSLFYLLVDISGFSVPHPGVLPVGRWVAVSLARCESRLVVLPVDVRSAQCHVARRLNFPQWAALSLHQKLLSAWEPWVSKSGALTLQLYPF